MIQPEPLSSVNFEEIVAPYNEGWRSDPAFFLDAKDPTCELVYHCCITCGWFPWEGMVEYRRLHGYRGTWCIACGIPLFEMEQSFPRPE